VPCPTKRGAVSNVERPLRFQIGWPAQWSINASLISRLSHAVDEIEKRSQQNRPWKVVTVRRGLKEDPDAALDRHFAAHPEDQDANVVIYNFFDEG